MLPDGEGGVGRPEYNYEYHPDGKLWKEIDPLGRKTVYLYNDRGELTKVEKRQSNNTLIADTEYAYNDAGLQTSVKDHLDRVTKYAYNGRGLRSTVTLPDPDEGEYLDPLEAPATGYLYDGMGRIAKITDVLTGRETTYSYSSHGSVVTITEPDPDGVGEGPEYELTSPVTVMTYDAMGNLLSVTDARGNVTQYQYDDLGRKVKMIQADPDEPEAGDAEPETVYAYDKAGNLRYVTDPLGNVTEYQYDYRNRLKKVIGDDPDGIPAAGQAAAETEYTYNDVGEQAMPAERGKRTHRAAMTKANAGIPRSCHSQGALSRIDHEYLPTSPTCGTDQGC